jgi:hypothetical protein
MGRLVEFSIAFLARKMISNGIGGLRQSATRSYQAMVKVNWLLHKAEVADEDLSKEWSLFQSTNPGYEPDLVP